MMRKSYKIPLIISCLGISSLLLFSYLTFIPNPVFADETQEIEQRTLMNIKYMQQLTPEICTNTALEKSKQLIDYRDEKSYWVTKLADGNCWMTQNLDFNINGGLTAKYTDVYQDIDDPKTTQAIAPKNWVDTANTANYFYDPGDYVYTYRGNSNDTPGISIPNEVCHNNKDGLSNSNCTPYFTKVTGDNKVSLDMHYHVGNYYSWPAATVQVNNEVANAQVGQSICPRNWKLPTGKNLTDDGSFGYMLTQYGLQNKVTNGDGISIYGKPLYFVYGGGINNATFSYGGNQGFYWSSTPVSAAAYNLWIIGNNGVSPDDYSSTLWRHRGYSVRCLVQTTVKNSTGNGSIDETLKPDLNYPDDPDLQEPEPDIPPAHGTANISVTVSPVISLDVATSSTSDKMTAEFTKVSTSEIITNVSSNYQYTVSISTEQTTLEQDPKTEYNIPMIGTGTNGNGKNDVEKSVSGWGIKKKLSATNPEELGSTKDEDKYSPVGIGSAHPEVFYKSNGAEALTNDKALVFEVGVGVDAKLPSGIYFTTVTLTAGVI